MKPGRVFLGTAACPEMKLVSYLMCWTSPERFIRLSRGFGDKCEKEGHGAPG